jgi:AraC family transcriptional regulator
MSIGEPSSEDARVTGRAHSETMAFPPVECRYERRFCRSDKIGIYCARHQPTFVPEHEHAQTQLMLTFGGASGELICRLRGDKTIVRPVEGNQYSFVPPRVRHSFRWKNEADMIVFYLSGRLLREHGIAPPRSVSIGDFHSLARLDRDLWLLGEMVWQLCRTTVEPAASYLEGLGTALASRLLQRHFGTGEPPPAGLPLFSPNVHQRLIAYIGANLRSAIGIADLAKQAGLSASRFTRIFKNTTGAPPLQYVLKCRVEKALELLRTGNFRIAEAAYEVGFCDQSHLDRHCRKFFGHSPKAVLRGPAAAGSCRETPETSKIVAVY